MVARANDARWRRKALATAICALFALEFLCVAVAFLPGTPDVGRAICFFAALPLLLILMALASQITLEFGRSGGAGELEHLLECKHLGALHGDTRSFWKRIKSPAKTKPAPSQTPLPPELAHHVQAVAPAPAPVAHDVLDRLVNWKRVHGSSCPRDDV